MVHFYKLLAVYYLTNVRAIKYSLPRINIYSYLCSDGYVMSMYEHSHFSGEHFQLLNMFKKKLAS